MGKRTFLIKNFKKISWFHEEKKISKIIKSDYQIQNLTLDDYCCIYLMTIRKLKLINKTIPTTYNSLKGNTLKKTIHN